MRIFVAIALCLTMACGGAQRPDDDEFEGHLVPEPLFYSELPDVPEKPPPEQHLVVAVSECTVEGSDFPQKTEPGILMSYETALHTSRLKVAYDEIRGLYGVDLRTMDREREVYERHLKAADDEIVEWRIKARRSWWERNKGLVGLAFGLVTGAALTIGVAAAIDEATE